MMRGRRNPRLWIRLGCLIAAAVLLWPVPFADGTADTALQGSVFILFGSVLAARSFQAGMILGLAFAGIVLFRKRWFCRYICPTGLILDGAAQASPGHRTWNRCPRIGRYAALLTFSGAVIGYPLFLWADPIAIFSNALTAHSAVDGAARILSVAGLGLLIVLSLVFGGLWCARLCPLGATQDMLAEMKTLLEIGFRRLRSGARSVSTEERSYPASRRTFLAVAAGLGLGFGAEKIGAERGESAPLRPPGAVEESVFSGVCMRCGTCIRSCPTDIIHADTGGAGITGLLAPMIRYKDGYCLEECNACTRVCPSGALRELDMERKRRYVIGEALVDGKVCFLVRGVNDCDICVRACPYDAVQVYWDEERYVAYPVVDPEKCNGCGACEVYCPTGDIKAIRVWRV